MLSPFKNRGIADAFKELDEVTTREHQCFVIGWLVENAHDLSQKQLGHIASLIVKPFKNKRGAPTKTERHWEIIKHLRNKYDSDKIIPTYSEVMDVIKFYAKKDNIGDESTLRAIYKQIKNYVYHYPAPRGRPKKLSKKQ